MMKKSLDNLVLHSDKEFQQEKVKFEIALEIINDKNSLIYTDDKNYFIAQSSPDKPIWIWNKDKINGDAINEIIETIKHNFNENSKITCKKRLYELISERIKTYMPFKMGVLYCTKTIRPKEEKGIFVLATHKEKKVLTKYIYDDCYESGNKLYTMEQAEVDTNILIDSNKFYILKDNNKIVCMAKYQNVENIARINKVYTPKEERCKGYCANLIYDLSNKLITDGFLPMLYTDYNYIPSNKSYMNVGYIPEEYLVSFYIKEK